MTIRPARLERDYGIQAQDERVIQAPGTLQHRAAAAAPAEDPNSQRPAGRDVHFLPDAIRIADHDKRLSRFPEA